MQSTSSKRRLKARELEEACLELRRQGWTYLGISKQLGVCENTVYARVKAALKRLNEKLVEAAEEVRRLELERLDHYLTRLEPDIEAGDTKAIQTAMKIAERRAAYLGLDCPKANTVELRTNFSDEEVKEQMNARGLLEENEFRSNPPV